jgi:uncharacterized RDD family membrane protein YckC
MHDDPGTQLEPMSPVSASELDSGAGGAAGFWRRFAAAFIDGLVVGVIEFIIDLILGSTAGRLIGIVISAVYFTYFHGSTGRTPGNAALGIRVVDIDDGSTIGYGRAFIRWIVSIPSALILLIGFLWMLWDPRKQTWHDKAAGSLPVVTGSNI